MGYGSTFRPCFITTYSLSLSHKRIERKAKVITCDHELTRTPERMNAHAMHASASFGSDAFPFDVSVEGGESCCQTQNMPKNDRSAVWCEVTEAELQQWLNTGSPDYRLTHVWGDDHIAVIDARRGDRIAYQEDFHKGRCFILDVFLPQVRPTTKGDSHA